MRRALKQALAGAGVIGLLALAGCSPGVSDLLPEAAGGLPSGAPSRPAQSYRFPAVHDMPAPRTSGTLSEEEQVRLEKELAATRDRQAAEARDEAPPPPPAAAPRNRPKTGGSTGAKPNP